MVTSCENITWYHIADGSSKRIYLDSTWESWNLKTSATLLFVERFVQVNDIAQVEQQSFTSLALCEGIPSANHAFFSQITRNVESGSMSFSKENSLISIPVSLSIDSSIMTSKQNVQTDYAECIDNISGPLTTLCEAIAEINCGNEN